MINERFIISLITVLLAIGAPLYFIKRKYPLWWVLSVSTPLLTGCLLLYYHTFIFNPSHGISIAILPLATWWLVWRRETTGKPAISAQLFVLLQILFAVFYVVMTWIQEY